MADIQPNSRPLAGPPPRLRAIPGATDCHMHFYMPGFHSQPGGPPIAEYATPEHYAVVQQRLGLRPVRHHQSNAYQFDNGSTLAALKQLGRRKARAVVTISLETTAADIHAMNELGVCGARIMNLPCGATPIRNMKPVEAKVRDFGWHLMVQLNGRDMDQYFDMLDGIETNCVLDHIGKFIDPVPADDPRVDKIIRLMDKGNCWFKIAGAYETSLTGAPDFTDVAAIAKRVIAHAPERILWGSNWPHVGVSRDRYPDDAILLDNLLDWATADQRDRILVHNPAMLFGF